MSIQVMSEVWKHSRACGNDLLLLLAMADHAHDDGICWPSIAQLADKTRISQSTVKRSIRALVQLGELKIEEPGGTFQTQERIRRLANRYRVLRGRRQYRGEEVEDSTGGQIDPRGQNEPPPGVTAMTPGRGSQLWTPNHHKQPLETTTTARATEASPAQETEVVVVSSAAVAKGEEPTGELALVERQQLETLSAKFGLSAKQAAQVLVHAKRKGSAYVLEQAEIVRATPGVKNAAGALLDALANGWKPRKKIARKVARRKAQELPVTPTGSERAPDVSAELAQWQQASPEQRSAWFADPAFALMRMPKEGLSPSRLFLRILGFVLGSREGHCEPDAKAETGASRSAALSAPA